MKSFNHTCNKLITCLISAAVLISMTGCSRDITPAETQPQATVSPTASEDTGKQSGTSGISETPTPTDEAMSEPTGNPAADPKSGPENDEGNHSTGTWATSDYISEHRIISTANGDLELILTGLTEESAAYVIEELKNFDLRTDDAFILEHPDFVDAEKWNSLADTYDETNDSNQCWAASISNMLWISGWTKGYNNPVSGQPFGSEDDIFRYFNEKITNRGCDFAPAVDFFFTGEFAPDWNSAHPAMLCDEPSETDGIIKDFMSSHAVREYDLIEDPSMIGQLASLDMLSSSPAVFEGSIGFSYDNTLIKSDHSINIVGTILDPSAADQTDRYKAVIIADSDDSGFPEDESASPEDLSDEQIYAEKAARPNCYAIYKLRLSEDVNGTKYWEMLDYSEGTRTAVYSVSALPLPSDAILAENRETEGSCSVMSNPDFVRGTVFTTANTESIPDPFYFDREETIKTVFAPGEAINMNFFVSNHGFIAFDDEYRGNDPLIAEWSVRSEDGSIVAKGVTECNEPVENGIDAGYLVTLNMTDGQLAAWPAGKYTASVTVNADHSIKEAYYLNNLEAVCEFEVTP